MPTQKSTPARILDAAHELLRTAGLARTTTKQIARAAGCSEAALYKHFASKEEIFVRVLQERLPSVGPLLEELTADPGERTVEECLTAVARRALDLYTQTLPIAGSLFAEPALLQRHREGLAQLGTGPRQPLDQLARYLRRERDRGRIRPDADPESAAALLLGACFQRVFLAAFAATEESGGAGGAGGVGGAADFAAETARTVLSGIA
ncbi:helix-turn-helix domain-containing protein [Streptomyces olivaceiscleroticus]|uniref:TetR/AcrR family transcriptional regulator n=1 Tax=Streptomyces olivaceiscleroticus TaxID=68245 RepID=A0ABP3J7S5_9ACTN